MTNFLYSLITFLIAIFFILLGLVGIILPWSTNMQTLVTNLMLNYSIMVFLFSFCILAIGVATAFHIILSLKRQYYHFKVHGQTVSVDTTLIHNYLQIYWKELFPKNTVPFQLNLKKNKFHIIVDLPYVEKSQQKELLERIRQDVSTLFVELLGYRQYFQLSASFQERPHGFSKEV